MDGRSPDEIRAVLREQNAQQEEAARERRGQMLLAALKSTFKRPAASERAASLFSSSADAPQADRELGSVARNLDAERSDSRAPNWLFWTVCTTVPITSGLVWVYLAIRTRRFALFADALAFFLWPLVGAVGVTALLSLAVGTDMLLSVGFDVKHVVYRDHVEALRSYGDGYQLRCSTAELGQMDAWAIRYDDMNDRFRATSDSLAESASLLLLLTWGTLWVGSIVHAQISWRQFRRYRPPSSQSLSRPSRRRGRWCFLLWAFFGLFGAHRYYLGRWMSGLLFMLSLGGLGIGWALDAFFLRSMLEQANRTGVAPGDDLAPWAERGGDRFGFLDFFVRLAFFIAAPALFAYLCVSLNQIELLFVLIFSIVLCGLLGNVKQWLSRLEILNKVPLVHPLISVISQLYAFYYEHRPRAFLYYVFAPLTAPIPALTSPTARREVSLYVRFLLTILGAVALNELRVVSTTYRYHSWTSIAFWVSVHLLTASAIISFILVPIITTTFTFNLSGRSKRLKFMSALAIVATFICGVATAGYIHVSKEPTFVCYNLLRTRLQDKEFQEQLTRSSRLFLEHYIDRTPTPDDYTDIAVHPQLTELFREEVLVNLTSENEAKVFQVFTRDVEGDQPNGVWLGVGVSRKAEDYRSWRTVFMLGPDGEFYTTWDDERPLRIVEEFEVASALWNSQVEHRLASRDAHVEEELYDRAKHALQSERPEPGVNVETYQELLGFLSQMSMDEAAAKSPSILDPRATRQLRRKIEPLVGPDAWQFRVFKLPRIQGRPWFGVADGEQGLCLLTPEGDFIARWDLEIFYDLHNVRLQFGRLNKILPRTRTSFDSVINGGERQAFVDDRLRRDLLREKSELFLRHYINTSTSKPEELSERYRSYVASVTTPERLSSYQVRELPRDSGRWLAVYRSGRPLHLMSPQGEFFTDDAGPIQNLVGESPDASIRQLTIALAPVELR